MKYTRVWHDGRRHWIFETRVKGPQNLRYGVLVDAGAPSGQSFGEGPEGQIGPEQPMDSIARSMPLSDFHEYTGVVPQQVKQLMDAAAEPPPDAE
jgi:hypothetical protein